MRSLTIESLLRVSLALVWFALPAAALAQQQSFVRASGQSTVSATPDIVTVTVDYTTQGNTAQEAADANATGMTRILNALKQLVGTKGEIKTTRYWVTPLSRTVNGQQQIYAYQATNSVQVASEDLNAGGRVIDTAMQAGATGVSGIGFGLKDNSAARMQALKQATVQAKMNVEAIASGLGAKIGMITSVEESSAVRVVPSDTRLTAGLAAGGVPTPVEAGLVTVSASVVLEANLLP